LLGIGSASLMVSMPSIVRAQSKTTVKLGIIGNSVEYYPVYVAKEMGFFDKEGVVIDIIATGGSSKSAQMTVAQAIDVGSTSWLDAIRANDTGAPIVIVANSLGSSTTKLLGKAGLKSVAELKGGRVSVGGAKDITMAWWLAMAKKAGLDGKKDVEVVFGGGTPARYAALVSGAVQAAVVATPLAFEGIRRGYTDFGAMGPFLPNVPYMSWQSNKAWADANQKTAVAFVRGHNEGIRAIYDPAHRDKVIGILAKAVNVSMDDARQSHDLVLQLKGFTPNSDYTDAQIQGCVDQLVEWGDIAPGKRPASKYADHRIVAAARLK
jgi:NitT/TauT family transport system substrate-binding protein